MSYGTANEMMIFPIIDIVRKELRNQVERGELSIDLLTNNSSTTSTGVSGGVGVSGTSGDTNIAYNTSIMSILESNDYELELERKDPEYPKRLTGVLLKFNENISQIISLIRMDGKLKFVKLAVMLREEVNNSISNPLGMGGDHYVEYVRNKRMWTYYRTIYDDTLLFQEERDLAEVKMLELANRNQELRNLYGITTDSLSYEELMSYMLNPLGMTRDDYQTYMENKWLWISGHPNATEEAKLVAAEENLALRTEYAIGVDVHTWEELSPYRSNPLGMNITDFITYMSYKAEYIDLDPNIPEEAARIAVLEQLMGVLLTKYYLLQDIYTYEVLVPYLTQEDTVYNEKVILRIVISLNYNQEGKLAGASSETVEGSIV